MPARNITVIPATINPLTRMPSGRTAMKRRVAGYARVSTDSDEQFTSYEAQVDYYTQYIKRNPEWEFVKVYTDEGISGTNTKHRDGFKEMIADALNGKIDLIVTKSVSRFARNTVDSLVTIRELKDKNVEVYFEKENIYTFDGKGELLITIMASLAQEESRSISENVTWGQRKRFADGKVSLPYKSFVGYKKGENDIPEVVPEEAELIRRIYSLFMSGRTSTYIAKLLTEEGIPAPRGGQKWQSSTIESILTNEKYKGCALLQKCFTVDFLTKKRKVNEGEVPQYFVENSHEAIISPEEWQAVQYEVARRKTLGKRYSGTSIFAAKIVCADCGAFYGAKVWHSNSKYKKTVWRCNAKFDGEKHCDTPTLDEEEIKARFLSVFNGLLDQKEETIENLRFVQDTLTDCTEIDKKIEELQSELEVVAELTRRCIEENSTTAIDQDAYFKKYNGYVARFERATAKLDELQAEREKRMVKADRIGAIMFRIMELGNELTEFDTTLWLTAIEKVTAHPDGMLTFHFYSGMQIDDFPQEGTR